MASKRKEIRIDRLDIKFLADESPDSSYLGEYTSKRPDPYDLHAGNAIKRHQPGRGEHGYWIPAITADQHRKELNKKGYSKGVADYLARKYVNETYRRMEALGEGHWSFIGCMAEAQVSYDVPQQRSRRIEHFSSAGLWGIESDSDRGHFVEVSTEELADLHDHLAAFGVDLSNWSDLHAQALSNIGLAA